MQENLFELIELVAVVTSAIYGIMQARSARMDALGVFTMAFAVAFGGGTLRDLFLDRHPLFWIANPRYTMIVFAMSIVTCLLPRLTPKTDKWLILPDALGLGLFGILGTQFALESQSSWFIAVLLGVITGTFGGVICDVVCNRVPAIFQPSTLYATCAFVGNWIFLMVQAGGVEESVAAIAGISTTVVLRLAAVYWNICLPAVPGEHPESKDGRGAAR